MLERIVQSRTIGRLCCAMVLVSTFVEPLAAAPEGANPVPIASPDAAEEAAADPAADAGLSVISAPSQNAASSQNTAPSQDAARDALPRAAVERVQRQLLAASSDREGSFDAGAARDAIDRLRLQVAVHSRAVGSYGLTSDSIDRAVSKIDGLERELRRLERFGPFTVPTVGGVLEASADCSGAEPLRDGTALVAPSGEPGSRFSSWILVDGPVTVSLDTIGSEADTVLEVYDRCGGPLLDRDDDGAGVLHSAVGLRLGEGERRLVRVESTVGRKTLVTHLSGTGRIEGFLRTTAGTPLRTRIDLSDDLGVRLRSTVQTGDYLFDSLSGGRYFVTTDSTFYGPWIDEIFDDVECGGVCDPTQGTVIELPEAGTFTADFTLDRAGAIVGRVIDPSGAAIRGARVEVYAGSGGFVGSTLSDSLGRYRLEGLIASPSYRVVATSDLHGDEAYDGLPCETGCDLAAATPVAVLNNETTMGIDFVLDPLGSISGRVTDAITGGGLSVCLEVWTSTGSYATATCTQPDGSYQVGGLTAGEYVVHTESAEYADELYDNVPCEMFFCAIGDADRIEVGDGVAVNGIDFALDRLGSLSGRVTDRITGDGVSARVTVYLAGQGFVESAYTTSDGLWAVGNLTAGEYTAAAEDNSFPDRYQAQLFDQIPCPDGCSPSDGTPIELAMSSEIDGVDFNLEPLGSLSVRLTRTTGTPIASQSLELFDAEGGFVDFERTTSTGRATFYVDPGSYRLVFADVFRGLYVPEVFDEIPCADGCDPTAGTPIEIAAGEQVEIDEVLIARGVLTGRVTEEGSGQPVHGALVTLYLANGDLLGQDSTSFDGFYEFTGFPEGSYRLVVRADRHLDEVWNDVPCANEGCNPVSGDLVSIANETTTNADFELSRGGVLEGVATSSDPSLDVDGSAVVLSGAGQVLVQTELDETGGYSITGLTPGSYDVAIDSSNHRDELYDNVPCRAPDYDPCLPQATSIQITGTETHVASFVLEPLGRITGTVTNEVSGGPVSFPDVRFYDVETSRTLFASSVGNDGSYTSPPLEPGVYKVRADHFGVLGELYLGIPCESFCDWSPGRPIEVGLGDEVKIDFELAPGPGISGRVVEQGTGRPLAGVAVDLWADTGELDQTTVTNTDGRYFFDERFDDWYLSTGTPTAHVNEIHDEIQCPGGSAYDGTCDPLTGQLVATSSSGVEIDFELEPLGGLFFDGFESGDTSGWSDASP